MERIALPTILLLAMFQLCPPLFAEGGYFDVTAIVDNVIIHGIYHDNVYNSMLYIFLSWLGISIPFFSKTLPSWAKYISLLFSAWWVIGSGFEIANFSEPLKVYNSPEIRSTYGYYVFAFTIGVTLITINEKWSKQVQ